MGSYVDFLLLGEDLSVLLDVIFSALDCVIIHGLLLVRLSLSPEDFFEIDVL